MYITFFLPKMLKNTIFLIMLFFSLFRITEAEVIRTVNNVAIDDEILNIYIQTRIQKTIDNITEEEYSSLLNDLIDLYLLSTQDEAEKLKNTPQLKAQIELQNRGLIAQAVANNFFKNLKISEEEIRDAYSLEILNTPKLEYKASHILVETEQEALEIIDQLNKGDTFEILAIDKSIGPSATNGGNLDWFSPNQMVKAFSDAVEKLKNGEYSKLPTQTQFGWHVILREDSKPSIPPTLESIRQQIEQNIMQKSFQRYIQALRSNINN